MTYHIENLLALTVTHYNHIGYIRGLHTNTPGILVQGYNSNTKFWFFKIDNTFVWVHGGTSIDWEATIGDIRELAIMPRIPYVDYSVVEETPKFLEYLKEKGYLA